MAAVFSLAIAGAAHAETPGAALQSNDKSIVAQAPVGKVPIAQETIAKAASVAGPPAEIAGHIADAAAAYVIDRNLLEAVAWRESRFQQAAKSRRGAAGVMQLMPGTARELGVDRDDARQNIFGGAAYLKELLLRFGGDVSLALAAYNAGPGAVARYGGVPPFAETRNYVAAITGRLALAAAQFATGQALTVSRPNYTLLAAK